MRRRINLAIAVSTVISVTLTMPAVEATFPGPNGKIAFERAGNIWVMNPDGTGQTRLTSSGTAANPQWSADGRKIAYDQGSAIARRDVWVMNGNGSGKYRVTTHVKNEYDPAWSPDGRWLAFVSDRRGSAEIFKVGSTVPFGNAIRLTTTAGTGYPEPTPDDPRLWDSQPNWSPDGARIAFIRYRREDDSSYLGYELLLATMETDGTDVRLPESQAGYGATCPSWGPAGARIAWADDEWYYQDYAASSNVWHSDPDGTGLVGATHFDPDVPWRLGCVSWSPFRGTSIVFSGLVDRGDATRTPAIYRVPAAGSSSPTRIAWNGANPDWGRIPA